VDDEGVGIPRRGVGKLQKCEKNLLEVSSEPKNYY